ncbi:MAG: TonB-dependent receptor [Gemmatimonadetes bacterium]|nr:TonB-dependent receptor [Gemmatimonadota bacterium]
MRTPTIVGALLCASALHAQDTTVTRRDSTTTLTTVTVVVPAAEQVTGKPMQLLTLPVTASITAKKAAQLVNVIDAEDVVKYLPSVFLRKRNNGDTQATIGTRVWGVGSSARSLVFADGVPITALIANNNNIGGPRWGLVSPAEIERIDMMYGPFSAAYAGNSMGAVMEITTRQPTKLELRLEQSQALQRFSLYGTRATYGTTQTTAEVGDRFGRFSVRASGTYQDSHSQPLAYVTSASFPTGTTGGFSEQNKLGAQANILGATGLLHTGMANGKVKLAYDFTPAVRVAYTFGLWSNVASSAADSYLSSSGRETYAGQAGFATGYYRLNERHSSHSLSLRTNTNRRWDAEAVGSLYRFDTDRQRFPTTASASDTSYGTAGRVAVLDGTAWGSLDFKGAIRSAGALPRNVFSAGAHYDHYSLRNPTWNTADWRTGSAYSGVATEGDGKTSTQALWAQDAWLIAPTVRLTLGARAERWRAFDGYNASGATQVTQPEVHATRVSPKAVLAWTPVSPWHATLSLGKAYRFATAAELYQLVSTGTTFTSPEPNLAPDDVLAAELRVTRQLARGMLQVALFQDDVHDAIISQFLPIVQGSPTYYSVVSNVDHVRARGAELVLGGTDLVLRGLELGGSLTYLDARTLALSGRANAQAPAGSAVGAQLPNIPKWRATFTATYHSGSRAAFTLAGRYSDKLYTTLDDADTHPNTYQGFAEWFVADARANVRLGAHWTAAIGVDNLLDRKYFLFHPFPQRTLVASAKYGL